MEEDSAGGRGARWNGILREEKLIRLEELVEPFDGHRSNSALTYIGASPA